MVTWLKPLRWFFWVVSCSKRSHLLEILWDTRVFKNANLHRSIDYSYSSSEAEAEAEAEADPKHISEDPGQDEARKIETG